MTRRDELREAIDELAGPLGPFTRPAERQADIAQFLTTVNEADVSYLIDLVLQHARTFDASDLWADQDALLLEEALVAAAARCPKPTIDAMVAALVDPATRVAALDVLGALRSAASIPAVLSVLDANPSESDLISVGGAEGDWARGVEDVHFDFAKADVDREM